MKNWTLLSNAYPNWSPAIEYPVPFMSLYGGGILSPALAVGQVLDEFRCGVPDEVSIEKLTPAQIQSQTLARIWLSSLGALLEITTPWLRISP